MRRLFLAIAAFALCVSARADLVNNPGIFPSAQLTVGNCVQATGQNTVASTGSPCGSGGGSGTVFGPTSSTIGNIATWSNGTGTGLADSGVAAASVAFLGANNTWGGLNTFEVAPVIQGSGTVWYPGNLNPASFAPALSPTITNGDTGATSSTPAVTITNASNPVKGALTFYPALPANSGNQLVQAGDAALIIGGNTLNQALVIGNDTIASGTTQGLRISSAGVSTNTFNVNGVATFAGPPLVGSNQQPVWYPGNLLDPLTVTLANQTFLDKSTAAATYLTQASAASTYLTQTNAASTYLTQANAASTYLTLAGATATYLTQATALSTYAQLTGGVITGSYAFNAAAATSFRGVGIRTGNVQRWNIGSDVAESGSNTGSDLRFYAYSDTGTLLGSAVTVVRATRQFQFAFSPTAPTPAAGDSSTNLATTAFVTNAVSVALPRPYLIQVNFQGAPTAVLGAQGYALHHVFSKTVTCPNNFAGAVLSAANFANAAATLTINGPIQYGTMGTVSISALQRTGNFSVSTTNITFNPGDVLDIVQSTSDTHLGGISLEIPCTSVN